MKRILAAMLFFTFSFSAFAQKEEEESINSTKGFKKENLFTGGDFTASFSTYYTVLGISPYFGYSVNKYLDVAASLNYNYTSQKDYYTDAKARQSDFGAGAFVRVFPFNFLFGQVQYEHNFVRQKYFPPSNYNESTEITKFDANSILVGGGISTGREHGNSTFYYFSVLWDVTKVEGSPYIDDLGRNFPILKAGVNIALFQGDQEGSSGRRRRRF